jgi:transposase
MVVEPLKSLKMNFKHFIVIDVSKNTFDFALIKDGDISSPISKETSNNPTGPVELEKFISQQGINMDETLFCMEHTGICIFFR